MIKKTVVTIQSEQIEKAKSIIRDSVRRHEGKTLLVVGDVGLDEYLTGDVRRISPEAPVPVMEVRSREFRVGLAANVSQNIQSLGGVGLLVGLIGADASANDLDQLLKSNGVSQHHLVVDKTRPTTRKVRVMSGQHHIVRIDFEERQYLAAPIEKVFVTQIEKLLPDSVGLILQDYGKGVLSESLCQKLIGLAHQQNKKVVVDPHRTTPLHYYKGADLIKPNRDEAFILSGLNTDDLQLNDETVIQVGRAIQKVADCKNLIITQGKDGVIFFQGDQLTHIPTVPRQVFDVTGAGDTYLAAFSLGWLTGLDAITAAIMANFAAGVVVGKIGSVPCTQSELIAAME